MNHRWVWHHDVYLTTETPVRSLQGIPVVACIIDTAGHEDHCSRCPTYRRMTESGHAKTYSQDAGKNWGLIGGKRPPCRGV